MSLPAQPKLEPGRVYRTRDLAAWSANPPRLAKRLVRDGSLIPLAQGLFAHPKRGKFGTVPPADADVLRAFLNDTPFVVTGPDRWNALGLGATAVYAVPLVYNRKRSGLFELGSRRYQLRRVAFPENPPPEWFVVDLLENADRAGVGRQSVATALEQALANGRFDHQRLRNMADRFGTSATRALIAQAIGSIRP